MEYRWQRDNKNLTNDDRHQISDKTVTIDKIQRQDNKITYRCIAQESGSRLSNYKDITLNVMYKPGRAQVEDKIIGPYFEGHLSDVILRCSVSDPGNPKAKFSWSKDGMVKDRNNQGHYSISGGQLSVSGHGGLWQCTPYNDIGNGQSANINITVYANPVFIKNISNQSPRAEIQNDLNVLCSIRGRPAPDVIWLYKGGQLPDVVTVISESDVINNKLITVNRRLIWSTDSTLDQRRTTSGLYTCIGNVDDKETKQNINIDVQYAPYNVNINISGNITIIEKELLSLTCAATCNPQCNYIWSKDNTQIIIRDILEFKSIRRQDQDPLEITIRVTPEGHLIQDSDVTVSCIVNSRPEPSSIKWTNITDPDLQDLDCSHKNNTHCMLTLSDINILDSGTYQCQVDNGVRGSPVSLNTNIIVYGPARWYKLDPDDHV
ncbi:hypothetical protein LSH36_1910g00003, partial [Paralvinella palmiformis]